MRYANLALMAASHFSYAGPDLRDIDKMAWCIRSSEHGKQLVPLLLRFSVVPQY